MAAPKLSTVRLTLREIKSKDIFAHTELFSDKETMKLLGGTVIENDLEIKGVIEDKRREFENGTAIFWVITLTEEKEFIGFIRLMSYASYYFDASFSAMGEMKNSPEFLQYIDKNGWEIDYALLKYYREKGIMTEAINAVLEYCYANSISPLYAKVNSLTNSATVTLLKKIGFTDHLPVANHDGELGMIYRWTT
jgi:ribosomal-protein-alanine N-acetyltransferase